jgi:hypothetical protein
MRLAPADTPWACQRLALAAADRFPQLRQDRDALRLELQARISSAQHICLRSGQALLLGHVEPFAFAEKKLLIVDGWLPGDGWQTWQVLSECLAWADGRPAIRMIWWPPLDGIIGDRLKRAMARYGFSLRGGVFERWRA